MQGKQSEQRGAKPESLAVTRMYAQGWHPTHASTYQVAGNRQGRQEAGSAQGALDKGVDDLQMRHLDPGTGATAAEAGDACDTSQWAERWYCLEREESGSQDARKNDGREGPAQ